MEEIDQLSSSISSRLTTLQRMKTNGVKIIGYIPNGYLPEELIYASGAIPVALIRGGDPEPVSAAAPFLGRFLDPFCQAQIGYRLLGKDPIYQLLDLLVVPVTDIHVRAIADSWDFYANVEVFRLGVPHIKTEHGLTYYLESIYLLKERLEAMTGIEITEERLRREIQTANKVRELFRSISLSRKADAPMIGGKDFIRLHHHALLSDRETLLEVLQKVNQQLGTKGNSKNGGPRIFLIGSTMASGDYKVLDLLEEAGASVVIEEFSEGLEDYWQDVQVINDSMRALAECYFARKVPPAFFRGAMKERFDFLLKLVEEFRVAGVVWYSLMYRECFDVEGYLFRNSLAKLAIPMLKITSDYDASEKGALRTRVETFLETFKRV